MPTPDPSYKFYVNRIKREFDAVVDDLLRQLTLVTPTQAAELAAIPTLKENPRNG